VPGHQQAGEMKTYHVIPIAEWPAVNTIFQRYKASRTKYREGSWPSIFNTANYKRHLRFQQNLLKHCEWVVKREMRKRRTIGGNKEITWELTIHPLEIRYHVEDK
jgi:hypothetical protein